MVLAILAEVGLALLWQWPGVVGSVAILLSLLAGPVAALAILATAVVLLFRWRPRKAMSAVLLLVAPAALWLPVSLTADYIHLALTEGLEVGQLGAARQLAGQGPTVHDWSVGMDGGPRTFLIFDATDAIAVRLGPNAAPSASKDEIEQKCDGKAKHLLSHYYVCSF